MAENPQVLPVACLRDNYAYLAFHPEGDGSALVIDPSEAQPVVEALQRHGLRLAAILNTHHHWDHVGGNRELVEQFGVPVYAHRSDEGRVPGLSHFLEDGDEFSLAEIPVRVLHVPGHTLGALAYVMGSVCFTGDTLFCGGCGRLFEGTPEMMYDSLNRVLGKLPDETLVYCGHEYTRANLEFAATVLTHEALTRRIADVTQRRANGQFCASASLGVERATNPFLRCELPEVQAALEAKNALDAFTALRRRKDRA